MNFRIILVCILLCSIHHANYSMHRNRASQARRAAQYEAPKSPDIATQLRALRFLGLLLEENERLAKNHAKAVAQQNKKEQASQGLLPPIKQQQQRHPAGTHTRKRGTRKRRADRPLPSITP